METGRRADEGHRRTVTLRLPGLHGHRRVRHPRFISISKLPYGTWAFRFQLLTEGAMIFRTATSIGGSKS